MDVARLRISYLKGMITAMAIRAEKESRVELGDVAFEIRFECLHINLIFLTSKELVPGEGEVFY